MGGDFNCFQGIWTFPVRGESGQTLWTLTYIPFDTRNKIIYDFEVGISTVFKFSVRWGSSPSPGPMNSIPFDASYTKNKNIYGLGVGISIIFKILGHSLFEGVKTTPGPMNCIPFNAP